MCYLTTTKRVSIYQITNVSLTYQHRYVKSAYINERSRNTEYRGQRLELQSAAPSRGHNRGTFKSNVTGFQPVTSSAIDIYARQTSIFRTESDQNLWRMPTMPITWLDVDDGLRKLMFATAGAPVESVPDAC